MWAIWTVLVLMGAVGAAGAVRKAAPCGDRAAPVPHNRRRSWRTRALAGLLGVGTTVTGLALAPSAPANADLGFERPDMPDGEFQITKLPSYPSWLMIHDGAISFDSETHVGVMHDEVGPDQEPDDGDANTIDGDRAQWNPALSPFDASRAVNVNELSELDPASGVIGMDATTLSAVGDIDPVPEDDDPDDDVPALGSPDLVTVDDGIMRLSSSLRDGLELRASATLNPILERMEAGSPVAVGFVDGLDGSNSAIWLLTDNGRILLFRPVGNKLLADEDFEDGHKDIPMESGFAHVLDGASFSYLDQDIRAASASRPGHIGVLVARDFGTSSSGFSTRIYEVAVDPATGRFTDDPAEEHLETNLGSAAVAGRLEVDVADADGSPGGASNVSYAAMVRESGPAEGSSPTLLTEGLQSGDYCHTTAATHDLQFDLELLPEGRIITCAADAGDKQVPDVLNTGTLIGQRALNIDMVSSVMSEDGSFGVHRRSTAPFPTSLSTNTVGHPTIDRVMLDIPCEWLLASLDPEKINGQHCSSGGYTPNQGDEFEFPPRVSTIVHVRDQDQHNSIQVISRPVAASQISNIKGVVVQYVPGTHGFGYDLGTTHRSHMVRMPNLANEVKIQIDQDRLPQQPTRLNPQPLAVLESPPYVNGAGQVPLAGPTYNARKSESNTEGTTTSNSVSWSLGVDIGDSSGMFGFSAEVGLEREVGTETLNSIDFSTSEQYVGSPVEDTIIYQSVNVWRFPGTIVESSTGVGLGTETNLDVPAGSLITSATLGTLQRQFPGVFTGGQRDKGVLGNVLTHTTGDPGSYTTWGAGTAESANVSSYCDGASFSNIDTRTFSHSQYPFGVSEQDNPFTVPELDQPPLKGPGILASIKHRATAGNDTSEGAGFSITNSSEQSQIANNTISADLVAKAFFVTVGAGASHSYGKSWTTSFGSGVDFLGYVGHLPTADMTNEEYDWHVFLCKKQMGVVNGYGGVPVWVLGYTVDGYQGSGGLDDLVDPPRLVGPTHSDIVPSLKPDLSWSQDEGTVKEFDVELDAIGVNDHRAKTGLFPITNTKLAKNRAPDVTATFADLGLGDLQPNTLYRWRVTSHDMLGNAITSDWDHFRTSGPPTNVHIDVSDPTPTVGQQVTLTIQHDNTLPAGGTYAYSWDFGSNQTISGGLTPKSITWSWPTSGINLVKASVAAGSFPAVPAQTTVAVGPNAVSETYPQASPARPEPVEDTTFTVPKAQGVMANDAGALFVSAASDPAHGTLDLKTDGSFTYQPVTNYCGADEFVYAVTGGGSVKYATASLMVKCVNDAPVLPGPLTYTLVEDEVLQVSGTAGNLLEGVQDPDVPEPVIMGPDATHKLEPGAGPAHGTAVVGDNGTFKYTPQANYCNSDAIDSYDTITVRAVDKGTPALHSTPNTTVRFKVLCDNDAPKVKDLPTPALASAYAATEDTPLSVSKTDGLKAGWSDVDTGATSGNDSHDRFPTFALVPSTGTTTQGGHVSLDPDDGNFTYTPAANYCTKPDTQPDTFTYTAQDGHRAVSDPPATVSISVACVNDAPTVVDQPARSVAEDTTLTVPAAGVLTGATDPDIGDTRTAVLVAGPGHGALTLNADGSYSYTPTANHCTKAGEAPDSFTFKARDGGRPPVAPAPAQPLDSNVGSVQITVTCVNDKPVAGPDTFAAIDAQPLSITAPGLLANDSDVEDGKPTVVPGTFTTSGGGTLVLSADGSGTYTSAAGFHGADTATYTVKDTANETGTGQITVNVKGRTTLVATRAVHSGGKATVSAKLTLTGNGAAVAGQTIRFVLSSGALYCTATTGANGVASCTATPPPAFKLGGRYNAVYDGGTEYLATISPSTAFGTLAPN